MSDRTVNPRRALALRLIDRADSQPFTPRGEKRRRWMHRLARFVRRLP